MLNPANTISFVALISLLGACTQARPEDDLAVGDAADTLSAAQSASYEADLQTQTTELMSSYERHENLSNCTLAIGTAIASTVLIGATAAACGAGSYVVTVATVGTATVALVDLCLYGIAAETALAVGAYTNATLQCDDNFRAEVRRVVSRGVSAAAPIACAATAAILPAALLARLTCTTDENLRACTNRTRSCGSVRRQIAKNTACRGATDILHACVPTSSDGYASAVRELTTAATACDGALAHCGGA